MGPPREQRKVWPLCPPGPGSREPAGREGPAAPPPVRAHPEVLGSPQAPAPHPRREPPTSVYPHLHTHMHTHTQTCTCTAHTHALSHILTHVYTHAHTHTPSRHADSSCPIDLELFPAQQQATRSRALVLLRLSPHPPVAPSPRLPVAPSLEPRMLPAAAWEGG